MFVVSVQAHYDSAHFLPSYIVHKVLPDDPFQVIDDPQGRIAQKRGLIHHRNPIQVARRVKSCRVFSRKKIKECALLFGALRGNHRAKAFRLLEVALLVAELVGAERDCRLELVIRRFERRGQLAPRGAETRRPDRRRTNRDPGRRAE